jgi:hypothetical protein
MSSDFTHRMDVPSLEPSVEVDDLGRLPWTDLPDRAAVVVFFADGLKPVLIAITASARNLARRRLTDAADAMQIPGDRTAEGTPLADKKRGRRLNLRSIVREVRAIEVGSAFEAEAVYLRLAREFLPDIHRLAAEKWRAWFVHVDPTAEFPRWTKTNLVSEPGGESGPGLVLARSAGSLVGNTPVGRSGGTPASPGFPDRPGLFLGPFPDKDSAGRFIESVTDCFDLCRFHQILVQSPNASACTYKEMGRCPAPCDGSEGMPEYRGRVAEAASAVCVEGDGTGVATLAERIEEAMREAATRGEFERAATLRNRLNRLGQMRHRSFAQVRRLEECRWLIVQRSTHRECVRVFEMLCGELVCRGDVEATDQERAAVQLQGMAERAMKSGEKPCGRLEGWNLKRTDHLGLAARHLFMPAKKHAGAWVHLGNGHGSGCGVTMERARTAIAATMRGCAVSEAIESREIGEE